MIPSCLKILAGNVLAAPQVISGNVNQIRSIKRQESFFMAQPYFRMRHEHPSGYLGVSCGQGFTELLAETESKTDTMEIGCFE